MPHARGRSLALSPARKLIGDLLSFARQIPSVPVQRRMTLAEVVAARHGCQLRPSWCAIFLKAFALVAADNPALRRSYLHFPRPRLYEHPYNVASIAVERRLEEEHAVLFAQVRWPERLTLVEIDRRLKECKSRPIDDIPSFRRALRMSRWPGPMRRAMWWAGLNVWGHKRVHYLGTFGVSVYSGLGAASLHPLSPLTTTLNYGVFDADGSVDVRLIYDHRVLDGASVARALAAMEHMLKAELLTELRVGTRSAAA